MLYVFYGDKTIARDKANALLKQLSQKDPLAHVARFNDENWSLDEFSMTIQSQGLFKSKQIVVLDSLVRNEVTSEDIIAAFPQLAQCEHIVLVIEGSLLKKDVVKLEAIAQKMTEYSEVKKVKAVQENIFGLSDALFSRNPQKIFIELERARLSGKSVEEVTGLLFWTAKTMKIASTCKTAEIAEMKNYTYGQGARGALVWEPVLDTLVTSLAHAPHESRRNGEDGYAYLTRSLLSLCA